MRFLGAASIYSRMFAKIRGPIALIIQGAVIAVIGLVVMVVNLGDGTASIQVDKGYVDSLYEHTTDGVYDATWIALTNNELFIFNKSSLRPNWTNQTFKGEKIDIYYKDETPRQIMAIQLYDQFGDATVKYTTLAYDQNPNTYQKQGVGPGFGEFILVVGLILAGIGGCVTYIRRRSRFA